jgi:outer membrane murein-binding lipoprotein Lpp
MRLRITAIILSVFLFAGCAQLTQVLQTASTVQELTESDVISGLKEALITGAKNAAGRLSSEGGYYSDLAVKIPLPDEAKTIVENVSKIPGGEKLLEDVVLSINRAAEDAAKEVAPIFVNSVTQMTVTDAFGILRGADNAATQYLVKTTYNELYNLYRPKISASTNKEIVAGISAQESWTTLTGKWNTIANSIAGRLAGFKPVTTDLDDYLTKKALDGMFLKVEGEELKIRKEISARVTPILQKVFGSLDVK